MIRIQEISRWEGELVLDRVEDGAAHIEFIRDGVVEKVDAIDANVLSDDHFHDGMTVAVEDGEIIPLERESAERERYVKQKIERMGKRMDDIEDE
jgi:hypothetical protein